MHTFFPGQRLALAAGVLASAGALGILLSDPLSGGPWRLEHAILPVVVAITVASGRLVGDAIRARAILSALGFAGIFLLGTALTVYTSVGSQKAASGDRAAAVTAHNSAVLAKRQSAEIERTDLAAAKTRLSGAIEDHLRESGRGGCRAKCQGIERAITGLRADVEARRARIAALEADLAGMGGERVAFPRARAAADVVAVLFGVDRDRVEAIAATLEPVAFSLLLELCAIVAFGFVHAQPVQHSVRAVVQEAVEVERQSSAMPIVAEGSAVALAAANDDAACPPVQLLPPASPSAPWTRDRAAEDVSRLVALGALPRQRELAARWGVTPGTVTRWLQSYERSGAITRRKDGRRKRVVARAAVAGNQK